MTSTGWDSGGHIESLQLTERVTMTVLEEGRAA
jgi:hypothetical protein